MKLIFDIIFKIIWGIYLLGIVILLSNIFIYMTVQYGNSSLNGVLR